jgi:HAD superfamily hydrolase (TIGR01509 family)
MDSAGLAGAALRGNDDGAGTLTAIARGNGRPRGGIDVTKAVIFDVDGTLVDSVDLHTRAWIEAFADFGHDIGYDAMRRQIGKGADQLMPVFLSEQEFQDKGKALEEHRGKLFKARYFHQVKAFPGVRALFERLLAAGERIALASSAKGDELQHYKEVAGITDLVDVETSSDDAEKSKPHPDIFEAAMHRLKGIDPNDMVVVGDTPHDAVAATKAGLRTVGVTCGGWSAQDLRRAGCVAVFRDATDLRENFEMSPLAP